MTFEPANSCTDVLNFQELELQHQDLVNVMTSNIVKLTQLEDSLLKELASSSGNILDNESLISTLEQAKENASIVKSKIEECNQTKEIIEGVRGSYISVSRRGSTLYFASSGLVSINNMYEFSLSAFIEQFKIALLKADENDDIEIRLRNLVDSCTIRLYKFTSIGIFEPHRLTYSFNLTSMIIEEESTNYDSTMMAFFTKGNSSLGSSSEAKPTCLSWLSAYSWELLTRIANHNSIFSHVKTEIGKESSQFRRWIQSDFPETTQPPQIEGFSFSNIEKLCLLRVFRPDRCYVATKLFVVDSIGEKFVKAPTLNYKEVYTESRPINPIIFILSKGADPQSNIQNLGNQIGFQAPQKLSFISLGQGQGPMAHRMLETAFIRGHWIVIQNCHLLMQWVDELEPLLNSLGTPHKDFRLWLTTEPSTTFPVGLLQKSFRIVVEPPDGMRLNMQSTLSNVNQTILDSCPHPSFRPLLYCLTFLHAVLQERKKYGKLGWNVPYDFNESDFNISRQLLSTYLSKAWSEGKDEIPWENLKYLIGDAMYGGRVSDEMDRRTLQVYFDEYFGDFIFSNGKKFQFSTLHSSYIVPDVERGKLEEYKDHIDTMPIHTKPGVLGLNPNADLKYFNDRMEDIWYTLTVSQMNSADKEIFKSRDRQIISKATEIMGCLPVCEPEIGSFELNSIRKHLVSKNDDGILTPCDIVLLQELDQWNKLCLSMHASLNSLLKALKGEIGMNDQLEDMADSLHEGNLPRLWVKLTPATTKKLPSWMSHFKKRFQQYTKWIESGQPKVMWLSGLHFPQSFLSALLQATCRKKGWALDETIIHTEVTKYTNNNISNSIDNIDGTYITGLYLEGASWDVENSRLTYQHPKSDINTELPLIKIVPVHKKSPISQDFFNIIYHTSTIYKSSLFLKILVTYFHGNILHKFMVAYRYSHC